MKVVPALLTDSKDKFKQMFLKAQSFTDHLQADFMDGVFVPSRSISCADLEGLKCQKFVEAHIMVEDPLSWVDCLKEFGAKRIIFHFEIKDDKEKVILGIKEAGLSVGLAVNPHTEIKEFSYLVDKVDTVLFMSVIPGFYGAKFIPEVLKKIEEFKKIHPHTPTGIDGGIKASNIKDVACLGIDFICVGSAILSAEDPAAAHRDLSESLKS